MGQPKITEIEAQLGEWEFLKELPQEIDGFKLTMGQGIDGQILTIASYSNEAMHSKLDLIYTSETFDYVPVKTIGMHTFRDIRYFCRDRDKFAKMMNEKLPELLADVNREKKLHPRREHIRKCKAATEKPFGVNIPLMYPEIDTIIQIVIDEGVKIVFTSAGNPKTWTEHLHQHGITVAHVVASSKFAAKCEEAGVDAIVAEGFEAGGHNGREETTTLCLLPAIKKITTVPVMAAGGIGSGESILAAMTLGADGVQIGTRFALTEESSAHFTFKDRCLRLNEGDTQLTLKQLSPVRLVKNEFFKQVEEAETRGASVEELRELLGKGRAKKGIFEGDIYEGEVEIGQIASSVHSLKTAEEVIKELINDFNAALKRTKEIPSFIL